MSFNNVHSPSNNPRKIEGSPVTFEYYSHRNSPIDVDTVKDDDFLNGNFHEDLEILQPGPLRYIINLCKHVLSLEHDYHAAKLMQS